ncbi:hypothetical protein CEXT_715961 [Caerostris extrusa]|uniref:Uncharacterized protein n=1 Tax=Caerostris extrusa TaxID=172846 RepID=A0AAV4TJC8_CAEEX|nr:hypothetical protein CEXT_715961 [Caerostris extrusa]
MVKYFLSLGPGGTTITQGDMCREYSELHNFSTSSVVNVKASYEWVLFKVIATNPGQEAHLLENSTLSRMRTRKTPETFVLNRRKNIFFLSVLVEPPLFKATCREYSDLHNFPSSSVVNVKQFMSGSFKVIATIPVQEAHLLENSTLSRCELLSPESKKNISFLSFLVEPSLLKATCAENIQTFIIFPVPRSLMSKQVMSASFKVIATKPDQEAHLSENSILSQCGSYP